MGFFLIQNADMNKKRVAIQGGSGCNHEIAARAYFEDEEIEVIPCLTFQELFDTLHNDRSIYGIVAIENTLAGSLLSNYTFIRESNLKIIGEYKLRIKHNLMALPGQTIDDIKEVQSHPMALAQTEAFFKEHREIKLIASEDTALSAKHIADNKLNGVAGIASELAAHLYNLEIIKHGIETNKKNFTRFLIVTDKAKTEVDELLEEDRINKSSIVFSLAHEEGSLSKILTILTFYNINLSKIQSLPIIGHEWEYMFYADLVFNSYTRYLQSLDAIRPLCSNLKTMGEYEKGRQSYEPNGVSSEL